MTHMDGKGMNILEENVKRLKELFPEIVTEGKVDFDTLRQVLGDYVEEDKEAYSFAWSGKGKALRNSQTPSTGTLRPVKEESKNWNNTQNLYIEGDNLEALNILQRSYFGRIKMIYIDPPYNTGSDFVYEDDFRDSIKNYKRITGQLDNEGKTATSNPETSGRYHRDWLNMMYPRLRLARNLLAENGVIFISIDDNELTNLRKICDDVFGEDNFITTFIWEKKKKPSFLHRNVGIVFDYVVCYAKQAIRTEAFSVETTTIGKKYPFNNAGNPLVQLTFPANSVSFSIEDGLIKPQDMSEGSIITRLLTTVSIKNGRNESSFILEGEWRYSQQKLNEIVDDKDSITISKIPFRPNHVKAGGEVKKMRNALTRTSYECETNEDATAQIEELFGDGCVVFDTPKPVGLLKLLVQSITYSDSNSIILDFFAGSATTAHAVMKLNAEDGGNRKFIMVQMPELTDEKSEAYKIGYPNISEIGKERIRRAGELVKKQAIEAWNAADMEQRQQMKNPDELDIGFKVFKLDSTNLIKWNPDRENLEASLLGYVDNLEPGRSEEDLLYEVMLKMGADLTWPIEAHKVGTQTIYSVGFGALMVCLSDRITTEVADDMARLKEQLKPETWKVVFKDSGFADDMAKTNIKETLKCAGLPEDAFTTL